MFFLAYIGILVLPIVFGIKTRRWYLGFLAFFLEVLAIMKYHKRRNKNLPFFMI
jgi:hypothetical protein